MTVIDVTARIQQIQSQLALLAPAPNPVSSDAFARALSTASATPATPTAARGTGSGQAVVDEARKYLGIPYVWGGTDPNKGLDCSGLVQLVYKNLGYELPRVSYQQATAGRPVASLAEARPGDILAFNSPVSHVAIYIGDNKMIEAPRPGKNVQISEVYDTPTAIRRVLPDEGVAGVTAGRGVPAGTPFADLFADAGQKYGVDPALLAAIAKQESGFNPKAVSHAGAQGLMQLMPGTAAGLGVTNSFDPAQAVDGAARLMRDLLDRFGRTDLALAAYNAGPGAVLKYDGIPPYPETQNYVRSVLAIVEAA
ncbi:MAG TPA: transglycosylase SLT domain-containing protein [Nocardioidaceae bacterium]|nr:transglycosylase SLT domain-containing protein [Nocardioidaceae bacterium]